MTAKILATVALLTGFLAACGEDERPAESRTKQTNEAATDATTDSGERLPVIALGASAPGGGPPVREESAAARAIMDDPEQIEGGKQLYSAMNCVGCHSHGGGGMGPPLMDQTWIYGGSIENIAASIREGRPNGMPTYRGHLPEEQIWQIAAYVRSLSQTADGGDASSQ